LRETWHQPGQLRKAEKIKVQTPPRGGVNAAALSEPPKSYLKEKGEGHDFEGFWRIGGDKKPEENLKPRARWCHSRSEKAEWARPRGQGRRKDKGTIDNSQGAIGVQE